MSKTNEQHPANSQTGLVISYFGSSVAVEAENGQVFQCHLRRNQALPVVGDRVKWQFETATTGIILGIEPRTSLLARGEARGKSKPIAANVDALVVVMAPPPIFSEHLVDRYLAAGALLNIPAILVVNKIDLLSSDALQTVQARLQPYCDIPYPVILSSIVATEGLQTLFAALQGKVAVLVGPSGVGKSSLIATLSAQHAIRTGEVSAKGTGKHTTTATRLYHLPQGGMLIDSPGVRDFSLWTIQRGEVLRAFKEFATYLTGCRFRDCQHVAEPGCAVQSAVADGKISRERYASFLALMKEAQ